MHLIFEAGGTNTRIGFSSDGENISGTEIFSTPQLVEDFLKILKDKSQKFGKIESICGGLPVVFDKGHQTIISSAHLPKWVGISVKSALEHTFAAKVYLDNETSLAGLGEAVKGAGKGYPIVAYITVGTGVGSTRVVNGKIDQKVFGFESGHQIIVPGGNQCTCGGKGHLETYVAGYYLEKKYNQKAENLNDPKIWDEVARYLAIGLHNMSVHWSPSVIVLGGSVSKSIPLEKLKIYLKEFSTIFPEVPPIILSGLGQRAGLFGALHLLTFLNGVLKQ